MGLQACGSRQHRQSNDGNIRTLRANAVSENVQKPGRVVGAFSHFIGLEGFAQQGRGAEFQRDQRRVAGPRADRSSKQGSSMLAEPHTEKGAVERPLPCQLACLFDPADGPNRFQAAFAQEVTDDFGEKELSSATRILPPNLARRVTQRTHAENTIRSRRENFNRTYE